MKPETTDYSPLPADEDESTPLARSDQPEASAPRRERGLIAANSLFFWACVGSIVCSLLNVVFVATNTRAQKLSVFKPTPVRLDHPSVYIGLDKLPPNVTRNALPSSLDVFPPIFHPVDNSNPKKIFPDDGHARFTFNGRVAPGDHNIVLSPNISMIAQYRVRDFGMERCAIVAQILDQATLREHDQTMTLHGDTSSIEVWNLTSPAELNVRQLSWSNKPKREKLLGRLSIAEGQVSRTEDFFCGRSGSLQTFELVCTGADCQVDFWQDFYFKPRFGIFVSQQPSI